MFCANCGSSVEDGIIFCPNCGAKVEETVENNTTETEVIKVTEAPDPEENNGENKKKKQKKVLTPEEQVQKKKVITKLIVAGSFFLFAFSMIFVAIFVGLLAINNPANEILDDLESGYYYSASSAFENDMHGRANKKLIEGLNKRLDTIWEDYQSGDYGLYGDIEDELETIEEMGIEEISVKLQETITNTEALHNSQDAFSDAEREEGYGDYEDAIYNYSQVIETDPNYATAQSKIKELMPLYREELFDSVDSSLSWNYYTSAFEKLYEAITAFPDDAEIKKKVSDTEAIIIAEADKLVDEKQYDEAIKIIEYALDGYPENKTLTAKIDEIEKGRPTFLKDLTESSKSKNCDYMNATATGAEFYGYFVFDPGQDESKTAIAEYDLEKKYSKFTATFSPNTLTNEKEKFTIEILVDGKVVKTIKNFKSNSKNEKVELDITGAGKIEIRVKSTDWNDYNYINMFDACLYK